jgi:ATP-dependent Clp protease ATP-binding subunit ClpA
MVESLTKKSIKAIMLAQDESRRLGHRFVGTEQILLGTLSEETSVVAMVLKSMGVTLEHARIEVEKIIGRGSDFVPIDIPSFSPEACRAIDLAEESAQQLGYNYIDTDHLLLGTLRIEDGIALQVLANLLANLGIDLVLDATKFRDLVVEMLSVKDFTGRSVKNFTGSSVKVTIFAQEESRRLGHSFVGTEQILLGILSEETSVAAKVLKSRGVTLEHARIEVEKIIGRGSDFVAVDIPLFSPKASRAINLSLEEARQLGSDYIDTEHLLLGTLRIEDGIALQILANLGVDATEIRDLVVRMLSENMVRIPKGSVLEGIVNLTRK